MAKVRKEPPLVAWTLLRVVVHLGLGMMFHISLMLDPVLVVGPIVASLLFEVWFLFDAGLYTTEKWLSGSKWSLGLAVMAWAPSDFLVEKLGVLRVVNRFLPFGMTLAFLLGWVLLAALSLPKAGE